MLGFESVSDEDLSGGSSSDDEEGEKPRKKLEKISSHRDLSEAKSDEEVRTVVLCG
jgi:hypothetical protein